MLNYIKKFIIYFSIALLFTAAAVSASIGFNNNSLILPETTTPEAIDGHAQVYTKSNNIVYFQDGTGTEHIAGGTPIYGETKETGGGEITVDTVNEWQMVTGWNDDDLSGLTYNDGSSAAITAFADAGGGQVTVTSNGHLLSTGAYISITGTTNYNGLFQIANAQTNTFEITDTFAGDDATGTWRHGDHFIVPTGGAGRYSYMGVISLTSAGNNKTYEFSLSQNTGVNGISRRKIAAGADVGVLSISGLLNLADGDHVGLVVKNITDATNMTIVEGSIRLHRIGN